MAVEVGQIEVSDSVAEKGLAISFDNSTALAVVGLPSSQNIDVRCLDADCAPLQNAVHPSEVTGSSINFAVSTGLSVVPTWPVRAGAC